MPRTVADTLIADAANTFLDRNVFAQDWVHIRPDGTTQSFVGDLDEHEPKPSQDGQGGEVVQRSGILTCPLSIEVSCEGGRQSSRFVRNGVEWIATGISVDDQLQEVLVTSNSLKSVRGGLSGNRQ